LAYPVEFKQKPGNREATQEYGSTETDFSFECCGKVHITQSAADN